MATNLKTGWIVIATSGPTMDGRKIEKEWLTDMAKSYDPSFYSAKLWPDHLRVFGSQGKVLALKAEPATTPGLEGEIQLSAIIAPTDELAYANKMGKYVHTSIELLKNFAGKGFSYLGGLGVTDTPASLGTSELQFNEHDSKFYIQGKALDLSTAVAEKESFSLLNMLKPKTAEQENVMSPEQFQTLLEANSKTVTLINTLIEKFSVAPAPAPAPAPKVDPVPAAPTETEKDNDKKFVSTDEFNGLQEKFNTLSTAFEAAKNNPVGATVPAGNESQVNELVL